jgi:hypothetical protein
MPTLFKQYTLEVTIEQFLKACSDIELQELELRLPAYTSYIKRDPENEPIKLKP